MTWFVWFGTGPTEGRHNFPTRREAVRFARAIRANGLHPGPCRVGWGLDLLD